MITMHTHVMHTSHTSQFIQITLYITKKKKHAHTHTKYKFIIKRDTYNLQTLIIYS